MLSSLFADVIWTSLPKCAIYVLALYQVCYTALVYFMMCLLGLEKKNTRFSVL